MHINHPELQYVLSKGQRGTIPQEQYAVFPQSGYAAFRGPWDTHPWEEASYLFFSAMFHSRTHKQADDFTFEWSELGKHLLIDAGRFAYWYDDPRRKYIESTRAHNTVEIDGRDYSRYRNDAFGSAIQAWGESSGLYFVESEVYRKRFFATNHRRILVYNPGNWVVVIDQLCSAQQHKYTQWFHFDPELDIVAQGNELHGDVGTTTTKLVVLPLGPDDNTSLRLVKGQEEPRLQGWTSLEPRTMTANYAAGYTVVGKNALFVTLLWLGDQSRSLIAGDTRLRDDGSTLEVRWIVDGHEKGFIYSTDGDNRALEGLD